MPVEEHLSVIFKMEAPDHELNRDNLLKLLQEMLSYLLRHPEYEISDADFRIGLTRGAINSYEPRVSLAVYRPVDVKGSLGCI